MSRQLSVRIFSAVLLFAIALFFTACATSHSGGSGSGSGSGTGSGGSGSGGTGGSSGPAPGGYAAGIGGAGQTSSAGFLTAVQIPGAQPIPNKINSNGTLTPAKVNFMQVAGNPMAMNAAIDPSGSFLYEAVQPGLYGFTINRQTGDLTVMPNSPVAPTQSFDAVAVDQLGKFVYAYGGGQVFAYTIQSGTGQLSPVAGSPFGAAASGQQFAIASDRIAVSQNDKFLYVATSNGIMGYTIDATSGALSMIAGSPFASNVPASTVVAPASGFLYETAQSSSGPTTSGIYGYSIDANTGVLTAISGSPFGPACGADNLTSPASGKFLFGASCGMYQIDASTGALTQLSGDPSTPNSIWAVFDPMGTFLWLITTDTNCWHCDIGVTAYQVDANTGAMTMVPNSFLIMQNDMTGGLQALAISH